MSQTQKPLHILIATGIYPPEIGGPAQYAKNLKEALVTRGHRVTVVTYGLERKLPTGLRHLIYFFKVCAKISSVDFLIVLDTFSAGMPAVFASRIFRKKVLLRTGGDFLWESYVERTGDLVLFRDFYNEGSGKPRTLLSRRSAPPQGKSLVRWSVKEKVIFRLTKWTLRHADRVIFSTDWQRRIFVPAYNLEAERTAIIENFYGEKMPSLAPTEKNFVGGTRRLKWKNIPMLKGAFAAAQSRESSLILDIENTPYEEFLVKIQKAYAVILVSLGDISPNLILDAIRCGKPFICTQETGFYEKLKDIGLWVDPLDKNDIVGKIIWLCNEDNYKNQSKKVLSFSFTNPWEKIAGDFLRLLP